MSFDISLVFQIINTALIIVVIYMIVRLYNKFMKDKN